MICDICKKEYFTQAVKKPSEIKITQVSRQVIFLTEQTEGRSTKPHFSAETFDACPECTTLALKGKAIYGAGAQGHNRYWFKDADATDSEARRVMEEDNARKQSP